MNWLTMVDPSGSPFQLLTSWKIAFLYCLDDNHIRLFANALPLLHLVIVERIKTRVAQLWNFL